MPGTRKVRPSRMLDPTLASVNDSDADAVVTVAPRSSDGLLEATIAKGRGCKPRYMLWAPIRHFHTVVVIAVVVLYMMYGPPAEQQCVVSMYLARAFVVVALVMANGALN